MDFMESMRLIGKAKRAARDAYYAEQALAEAKKVLRTNLAALHRIAPVRQVAASVGLAPATVSSLWLGHVSMRHENILACLDAAEEALKHDNP